MLQDLTRKVISMMHMVGEKSGADGSVGRGIYQQVCATAQAGAGQRQRPGRSLWPADSNTAREARTRHRGQGCQRATNGAFLRHVTGMGGGEEQADPAGFNQFGIASMRTCGVQQGG